MRRTSGFTLIELLVVIAIIAILAAILFPVFMSAKERSKITSCAARQKQLASAFLSYTSDWDNRFPSGERSDGGHIIFWHKAILTYMGKSFELPYCTGIKHQFTSFLANETYGWVATIGANIAVVGTDYAGVNDPATAERQKRAVTPVRASEIGSPSKTLLLACSSYYNYNNPYVGHYAICPGMKEPGERFLSMSPGVNPAGWNGNFFDPARHGGVVVVAHADGHVAVYKREKLLNPGISGVTAGNLLQNLRKPNFSIWDLY
ncbi:MAG: prepilin-type N-terminal cleavage/methylation domain-containing protein [Armatimonadetes bacterium]|nr:prepilin-type N-terminal cleavage/methylation domain-containing protein [Armatimonadota bacterium]